ncbi:hypothetical protein NBRC10512_000726 [Rhodotorula toruloides]|uniref:Binuclear zinc transcription factor n=1 Tax=Rhodotorula toruloides (strain NP11) TaxID=1130832 RepID=M7XQU8_RHOT1|nr:binuclear zinc transcription factor [Rhodotorula toruloides NP11]EMS22598.1 binuclear zinc transcription factor [Rhodotorula toruloides NP11]
MDPYNPYAHPLHPSHPSSIPAHRPSPAQSHTSGNASYGDEGSRSPPPPSLSLPGQGGVGGGGGRKRPASDSLAPENASFDAGGREESVGSSSAGGGGGAGTAAKRGKTAAPPLKRGSACTLCRKRKLRCDGVRPKCGTCLRLNHECQYGDPTQERIAEKHRELEERIRSLEAELDYYRRGGPASTSAYPTANGNGNGATNGLFPPPPPPPGSSTSPATHALPLPGREDPHASLQPQHYAAYNGGSSDPYGGFHDPSSTSAQRDSEAFPLPPPHLHPLPSSSAGIGLATPAANTSPSLTAPAAHLQSFPFPINPTPPNLSDLINPPLSAGPTSAGGGTGAGGGAGAQFSPESPVSPALNGGTLAPSWGTELPSLEVMLDLSDLYFSTLHQHLPFLHRRRFLYTLHHPSSLASPPSQSLIFSVLAVAAAYHDSPLIRAQGPIWYALAREKVDVAISAGVNPHSGNRVATLTVEMVQALCLLSLVEMGQSDHQRAFLSMGQAVRIAAMLGLHRMDEDRVALRTGSMSSKRLRPPALHPLPRDPVLLEECRRTMCTVYILDRFESATVGWPSAIAESDVRILLPCADELFESGLCDADGRDNPLFWPADDLGTSAEKGWKGIREEEEAEKRESMMMNGAGGVKSEVATEGVEASAGERASPHVPKVGTFAWLCRVVWLGGRIQAETYRDSGPPAGGPWNKHVNLDPLESAAECLEMDQVLDYIRNKFSAIAAKKAQMQKGVDGPVLMILIMFTNLFHLRAASGLSRLPWDPSAPIYVGSSEYAMQRCWEAIHSLHEILSQLAAYENSRTTLHRSRANVFTSFVPYTLFAAAFPSKLAIGDWSVLVAARDRTENVPASVARDDLPSGDDAFPPHYLERRLAFVDVACDAMDRMGVVWPVGKKFAAMIRGDRMRLAARAYERSTAASAPGQPIVSSSPHQPTAPIYHSPPLGAIQHLNGSASAGAGY